jgi:Flp pilus assembly protein TadD
MRKTCSLGLLLVWICAAQDGPRTERDIERIQASLLGDLRGAAETAPTAGPEPRPRQALPGTVSVAQLRHKSNKNAQKHTASGIEFSATGDRMRAVAEFRKAIAADPEFVEPYLRLGVEYTATGRYEDAEVMFRRSLVLDPADWSAHYDLAVELCKAGNLDGAEQSARRALELSKGDAHVRYLLGELLMRHDETTGEGIQQLRLAAPSIPEANQALTQLRQMDK